MDNKQIWALARIAWEARVREAWGPGADLIINRLPWQSHAAHPLVAEDHLLVLAQVKAIIKELKL